MNYLQQFFTCIIFFSIITSLNGEESRRKSRKGHRRRLRESKSGSQKSGPLLVFMLDGYRWDYYNRLKDKLPGFSRFLREGVQAEWVDPVFPILSYPNWASLSTGVYPETHGVIGNHMLDLKSDPTGGDVFNLGDFSTTKNPKWWQNSEPIWITATKHNKRAFLRYWSRCDVPYHGMLPEEGTGYEGAGGIQPINKTLSIGLDKLLAGFDLVMIYGEHIDNVGHRYGPNSYEMEIALLKLDEVFLEFLEHLDKHEELKSKLNIIITSDHGMTETGQSSGVKYLSLEDYIDKRDVFRAVDGGSMISITPMKGKLEYVYKKLKNIPGIDVYKREDIPEDLHYKNDPKVLDILLICKDGYVIRGMQSSKQIPRPSPVRQFYGGVHGYTSAMADQRAIFYARGPAFRKNVVHSSIQTVDIYQIYTHCLKIPSQEHNGTWVNVAGMLV